MIFRKRMLCYMLLTFTSITYSNAQEPVQAAGKFMESLNASQKLVAVFPFDTEERYNFHFVPRTRKGIVIGDLNATQKQAALTLVRSCLSEQAAGKVNEIMDLENILRGVENRDENDTYRDPRKYYFSIFGVPGDKTIWGWRIEGHHISFNFSVRDKKLVSGTPGFLGANPAIVKDGPDKGKQILREETELGFAFIKTLSPVQLQKTVFNSSAPSDIVTSADRKAMIDKPAGIYYRELSHEQQQLLLQLVKLYVNRFTKLFADDMLKQIQEAGLDQLQFAWAGNTEGAPGKTYYYRVQGPTLIIEYDNSQNGANHIHTVVRDFKNDFGGDALLEHYRAGH